MWVTVFINFRNFTTSFTIQKLIESYKSCGLIICRAADSTNAVKIVFSGALINGRGVTFNTENSETLDRASIKLSFPSLGLINLPNNHKKSKSPNVFLNQVIFLPLY